MKHKKKRLKKNIVVLILIFGVIFNMVKTYRLEKIKLNQYSDFQK